MEIHEPGAPVFDPTAVVALTGDADDLAFASVFVGKFRHLLPQRVRRIAVALGTEDHDDALDAVLSLKVSSCLIGAGELCLLGRTLEAHLRRLDLGRARLVASNLAAAADRADAELGAYLAAAA